MGSFRAFFVIALVWLAAAPSRAQVVTPLPESNFTVMNGAKAPQLVVPLRPLQGVSNVSASLRRVTVNDVPRPTSLVGFVAKYVEPERQLSVEVDGNLSGGLVPGVYELSVELEGKPPAGDTSGGKPGGGPAEPKRVTQVLELQLNVPPARLAPIPPIKLSYERGYGQDVPERSIVLAELSGITTLTSLSVLQTERATNGEWQTDARFKASGALATLGAGQTAEVTLAGTEFPLGITKGQVVVSSRQLDQPVIVPFEVKARLCSVFIIPVFLVVGIIGWIVRYGLRQLEARAVIEARLAPLLRKVVQVKLVAEPQIQSALADAEKAVAEALQGSDQSVLEAKVAALQVELDRAVAAHASAIGEGFKTAAELERLLNTPWDLPSGAAEQIAGAGPLVAEVKAALVADDVARARTALGAVRNKVSAACADVDRWIGKSRSRVAELVAPSAPLALPASARALITADAKAAEGKLAAAGSFDPTAFQPGNFAAGAEAYLRVAHAAHAAVRQLVQTMYNGFWAAGTEAMALLRKAAKPGVDLSKMSTALEVELPDDPADAIERLRTVVREFAEDLAVAIGAKTTEAKDALQAGDYLRAMRVSMGSSGEQILSGPDVAPPTPPAALPAPKDLAPSVAQAYLLQRPARSDPVVFTQARLEKVQLLRGAVSAVILAVATWLIYRDAWVGTLGDFTTVAVVAFFSDFTLDAVLGTLEKLRKVA